MDSQSPPEKVRWGRSQRFELTPRGVEAEAEYRKATGLVTSDSGRAAFEGARGQWAQGFRVEADDAQLLGELIARPATLEEITRALETCGVTKPQVKASMERLVRAELVALSPTPVR